MAIQYIIEDNTITARKAARASNNNRENSVRVPYINHIKTPKLKLVNIAKYTPYHT
jgi:hypothetical protein